MNRQALPFLKARWQVLALREKILVAGAIVLVISTLAWQVVLRPALATWRASEQQHRSLDLQLQHMQSLQAQAKALQAQPKQNYDEARRLLELSVQQLGTTGRLQVTGEQANVTLTGTSAEALAQWLTQARVNARALPSQAHLQRNSNGLWDGTLVLTLPPRR